MFAMSQKFVSSMPAAGVLLFCTLTFARAAASEIDDVTYRQHGQKLRDSKVAVERLMNQMLQESASAVNAKRKGCDEFALYKDLRTHFNHFVFGDFVKRARRESEIHLIYTNKKDSIYGDMNVADAIGLTRLASGHKEILGPILRINRHVIGLDKLEHLFSYGFDYFKINYLRGQGLRAALAKGERDERGYVGLETTGVYSYGDLAANFHGMRFWNHMLGKNVDVFGARHERGPYFACKNGQWIVNQQINLDHYVDESWVESTNCSAFRNERVLHKITAIAKARGAVCDGTSSEIKTLVRRYGWLSEHIINSRGWHAVDR